jgi:ABC-2 type transport system ATP-binding protein
MTVNAAAIEVKELKKSYKKVQVLQGVTFTVTRGSIFALLGANGAGKTTTINILTTLQQADGGSASVDGLDISRQASAVRQRISLTGQFAAVDDVLTGRENLLLIGELRHVLSPRKTAEELLQQFDLADAADRRTLTYSGGMRRRLDIAMSLIGDPSIIFLDEPTAGLDPQSRTMMWETIRKLAERGKTIFLTTQYLEEADQLADYIAILQHGRIVADGTPQKLKKLLPQGKIEFRFRDERQLNATAHLFAKLQVERSDEELSLTVSTDGSVAQLTRLLNELQAARIVVMEFSQKVPTLDEAFIKIIETHKEKQHA